MATDGNSSRPTAKRRLYFSSQPQLLLLHEKDSEYVAHVATQLTDLLDALGCGRWTTAAAAEIHAAATLLYYGMTVGRGYQTLGQEYVDSFMALEHRTENGARVAPMTVGARTLLVAIRTAMVYCAQRSEAIQQLLSASLRRISSRWHGALRRVNGDRLLGLFTFVANVHLLYFFANGRFYDYAMRIAGVRMLTNQQFRTQQEQLFFRSLVLVLGLQVLLEFLSFARQAWAAIRPTDPVMGAEKQETQPPTSTAEASDVTGSTTDSSYAAVKCPLCMGDVTHPSATPCGHIFCWSCVLSWCQSNRQKSECAICRRPVRPQDILPLYNYRGQSSSAS